MALMAPGVSWEDCHRAAVREIVQVLFALGCCAASRSSRCWRPTCARPSCCTTGWDTDTSCDIGHFIGCDTQDVCGYNPAASHPAPAPLSGFGVGKLRTSWVLAAGMVLTNEPGCYFIMEIMLKQHIS